MKITFMIITPIILITIFLFSAELFSMGKEQNCLLTRLTRSKSCPEFKDIVTNEKEIEENFEDELWQSIAFLSQRVDDLEKQQSDMFHYEKQTRQLILGVLTKVNILSENAIALQGYYIDFQKATLQKEKKREQILKKKKFNSMSPVNSLPFPEEASITKERPNDENNLPT